MGNSSIRELIDDYNLIMPDIQREFVWDEERICKLFDSILRGYPIGNFLIWKINGRKIKETGINFYKFLNNYDEFGPKHHGDKVSNESPDKEFMAVLDGQQRIQSLIIGLRGFLNLHIPGKWKNKPDSYIEKKLYINLLSKLNEEDDYKYELKFLTKEESVKEEGDKVEKIWFEVGKILQCKEAQEIIDILEEYELNKEDQKRATKILNEMFSKICNVNNKIISWYQISSDSSLDEVLDIFVRTNSGGIVLSKTDLLFSTFVSNWNEARENFEELLDTLNNKGGSGPKFKFTKDFLMRTFMYLLDKPIIMKVENFKENILNIKENWELLSSSMKKIPEILTSLGFDDNNIISYNAIMPIAYYLFKGGEYKKQDKEIREEFKKYLVVSQLKRLYGVASNSTLTSVRNCLRKQNDRKEFVLAKKRFCFEDLKNVNITGGRTFAVDSETIEEWFNEDKNNYTFFILTLLYPNANIGDETFHQDHMHPESKLKKYPEFAPYRNRLANLQLLEGSKNESKNDVELKDWLKEARESGKNIEYLQINDSKDYYELINYLNFLNDRKALMKAQLEKILIGKNNS